MYIFELNSKYDIDGSYLYNKARYINHSCNPNCEVEISRGHIWIVSRKRIKKGQELSYDYGYEFDKNDLSRSSFFAIDSISSKNFLVFTGSSLFFFLTEFIAVRKKDELAIPGISIGYWNAK